MGKALARTLVSLTILLGLCCCTRAKPPSTPTTPLYDPMATNGGLQFRLHQAVGKASHTMPHEEFVVTLENCQGSEPLTQEHHGVFDPSLAYTLDTSSLRLDVSPYRAVIESVIRQAYGMEGWPCPTFEDAVPLTVQPATQTRFVLRWEELRDRNALDVVSGSRVIASLPLTAPISARLALVSAQEEACAGVSLAESLPTAATDEEPSATEVAAEVSPTPSPGEPEAVLLVRQYLDHINGGELPRAYDLLDPSYQARLAFERYAQGYAPVRSIEIVEIAVASESDGQELVEATLNITMLVQGEVTQADWRASYEIAQGSDVSPYGRTISAVRMHPSRLDENGGQ